MEMLHSSLPKLFLNFSIKKNFFSSIFSTSEIFGRIELKFKGIQATENVNYVGYNLQSAVADFGGLLGLFMGYSLLSFAELFYHCFASCLNKKKVEDEEKKIEKVENVIKIEEVWPELKKADIPQPNKINTSYNNDLFYPGTQVRRFLE